MENASVEELSSILPFEVASSLKRYLEERKIDKQS